MSGAHDAAREDMQTLFTRVAAALRGSSPATARNVMEPFVPLLKQYEVQVDVDSISAAVFHGLEYHGFWE